MSHRKRGRSGGKARSGRLLVALVGLALTLGVIGLDALGALAPAEGFLLDKRMVWGQRFAPRASDDIVHVNIDDEALEEIGRWPWDRELLAMAIDALSSYGAKVIVLDLLLPEAQRTRYAPQGGGRYAAIEDDRILADAIARAGNVVMGVSVDKEQFTKEEREEAKQKKIELDSSVKPWRVARSIPVIDAALDDRGFVNVQAKEDSGVVRHMPPTIRADGAPWWQLGVIGAARFLDLDAASLSADSQKLRVGDRAFTLNEGRALIAWRTREIGLETTPWIRTKPAPSWKTAHRQYSIKNLVNKQIGRRQVDAIVELLTGEAPAWPLADKAIASIEESAAFYREIYQEMAGDRSLAELRDGFASELATNPDLRQDIDFISALLGWENYRDNALALDRAGDAENFQVFHNKLVFVGWTGTGALADFYPTALDKKTPGVTVHAAIANSILTGHWKSTRASWAGAAWWTDLGATIALGIVGTAIAVAVGPGLSWLAAIVLGVFYLVLNAVWWFDAADVAIALAAPLVALGVSWAGCTTVRAVQEGREKAAVRRQFAARVSGQLVEFLEDNPNLINMEGEERELTMLFTDFAGFTAISERLEGPQTVAILNRFLRAITDVLLDHNAYVNKFMGDGAMAFWGAPMASDRHATDACLATVDCFAELDRQNVVPEHEGLPPIGMRAGIATGTVIVGDCGAPPKLNDYTVIGDAVNLAARLESANKQFGTRALVTRRTYDMLDPSARDAILWRPMGRLRVVGQGTPNEILEMVCRQDADWCDSEVRDWVKRTEEAVDLFTSGQLERAMPLWQDLVVAERGSAGAMLYVERINELLESGQEDFVLPLRSK